MYTEEVRASHDFYRSISKNVWCKLVMRITRDPRVMTRNRLKVASQFCIKRERNKDRITFRILDSPRTFVSWFSGLVLEMVGYVSE